MNLISKLERIQSSYYNTVQFFMRPNGDLCIAIGHQNCPDDDVLVILPFGQQHILFEDDPDDEELLNIINEGG
jgi:hypothetical protein